MPIRVPAEDYPRFSCAIVRAYNRVCCIMIVCVSIDGDHKKKAKMECKKIDRKQQKSVLRLGLLLLRGQRYGIECLL